jgi:hypothetical protein
MRLGAHGVRDLGATVSDVGEPQARRQVEVFAPTFVDDDRPAAGRKYQLSVTLDGGHVSEGMPEVSHGFTGYGFMN